jgi:protein-disulfide isomerase
MTEPHMQKNDESNTPQQLGDPTNKKMRTLIIVVSILVAGLVVSSAVVGFSIIYLGQKIVSSSQNKSGGDQPTSEPVEFKIPQSAPFLGHAEAPITVVIFADYQCPFCGLFHTETFPDIKREYIDTGKVKFYYLDFAFLGEESHAAAEAAKCAGDQGKYWEYHDTLYANQSGENEGAFNSDTLKKFATSLGLKQDDFNSCFDSGKYKNEVDSETQLGTSAQVNATPTVFINGFRIEGAADYNEYKKLIEEQLSK